MEGQQLAVAPARPGLREHAEVARRVVVEAAHAGVGAVVVVEGAVLHHEEDDVLDRAEVGAGRLGGRRRPGDGRPGALAVSPGSPRPAPGAAGGQRGGEEGASVEAGSL